jgi:hypothetical protein
MTTHIDTGQQELTQLAARAQASPRTRPLARLVALRSMQAAIVVERTACVAQARAEGETWQAIGDALGCRKQAAQAKYGSPRSTDQAEDAKPTGQKSARRASSTGWDVTAPGGVRLMSIVPRTKTAPGRSASLVIEGAFRLPGGRFRRLTRRPLNPEGAA